MPNLYIIAGCNGAGKTTAANTLLPEMLNCREFVNADAIAAGISPFNVEGVAIEAGRIMLNRIEFLLNSREDFAIETTLATKSYVSLVKKAQATGYKVSLIFIWLNTPEHSIQRVASRVSKGGHNIPNEVIKRRFERGRHNLHHIYIPICDFYTIITTDNGLPEQVKTREAGQITVAIDSSGLLVNTKSDLSPENVLLRDKILKGAREAYKNLLTTSAAKNQSLVIADEDGNIHHVPAVDLLKKLPKN
jgi:predicted ABC-type ATPase